LIDGFPGTPGPSGNNVEVALDIDMVAAMAPGLSGIQVYEATNDGNNAVITDELNRIATDDTSRQISSSWLINDDPSWDPIYLQYAAQGQSFFQCSGDNCAYVWSLAEQERADDPNVTIVGGTTLTTTGPQGNWLSETVWNWNSTGEGDGGSGGGISPNYPIPSWQLGINMSANGGSTTMRNIPDVALTADNLYIIADNGTPQPYTGGTSAATPLWAAFTALMNQQAVTVGKPALGLGFLNPTIYSLCKGPLYRSSFHDIITGNNTNVNSPNQFYAVSGYDLCTGWGTPAGSNLINAIVPLTRSPVLAVVTNIITGGNGNGIIDFDECNNLTVVLTNEGNASATHIVGTLSSSTFDVVVAQGTAAFPDLNPGASGASTSSFTISTSPDFVCGTPVNLTLIVKCDQAVETNLIELTSGILGTPDAFTNSFPMSVQPGGTNGISSPIFVQGLDSVGKITVSVYLQAVYDSGLTMQLISPNGTSAVLSANNGALGANYGSACGGPFETTFDDSASQSITLGAAPFVGSFQPQQSLSIFNLFSGTNLNGIWTLNVLDEFPGDIATLECWTLSISPEVCVDGGGECPGADLSITMSANPSVVLVDSNLVYNLTVSNAGPSTAKNVAVTESLPNGVGFVAATNYPVTVTQSASNLNLTVGTLPVYGTATIAVVTIPTLPGLATSVATVGSPSPDPNPDNNTASATALVTLPTADLAVSMTAAPNVVLEGGLLTYTISVTNNGPFAASQVVLNNTLPPNINLITATTTQGTISTGATTVYIGPLGLGTNVVVTLVVSPTTTGNITASTQVTLGPAQVDPVSFNNVASVSVTVGPSADLGVSGTIFPSTVLSGSHFTTTAEVFNNGPSPATGVVLSQTIPAGASFVSSSVAGVVVTNGAISWNVGNLADGSSLPITNVFKAPTLLSGVLQDPISSTLTVFGQPGDANTNNNVIVLQAVVEPPTIDIVPISAALISQSPNGAVNPGQSVQVQLNLQNAGNVSTTNLTATLQSTGGVTLPSGSQTYGVLAPGAGPVGRLFSFTANSTNGGTVVATLQLQDGSDNLGTVAFDFYMPVVQTFWNTNFIAIPNKAYVPEPDSGPASPYPSLLIVSNVSGLVSDVTVTVSNLSHTYPHDICMMLTGPLGQDSILMVSPAEYSSASDVTMVFDSTSTNAVPGEGPIVSGTYEPVNYNPDFFFTNAPPLFTNVPPPPPYSYGTNLGVFNGLNPNGTWSLYIVDDAAGDAGNISNGWALTVTTVIPVSQTADLAASIVESSNQVTLGNFVTNLLSITNNGATSINAYLTNLLPAGLSFVSSQFSHGSYTNIGQTVLYNLGVLGPGTGATITNVVMAVVGGLQTNTVIAGSVYQSANNQNSATVVTSVNMPFADIGAFISVAPNPVVINDNAVYTLVVTNYGPSNAFNVTGTFTFPGLSIVSASEGYTLLTNGAAQFDWISIAPLSIATVVVTATSPTAATITNTWTVSTASQDTYLANNSFTTNLVVTYPIPVFTNVGVSLVAQGVPANGAINSGQTVTVAFTLTNTGSAPTTNLIATLQSNVNIIPVTSSQNYGTIPVGGSATAYFAFTAQGLPGAAITNFLLLTNNGGFLGSVSNVFFIPLTTSYSQPGAITIPYYGPGTPYPSQITVSGLTGLVSKVTATLNGFSHTFPHDVNVLLASPAGQELFLMAHCGGPYSVSNANLNFDDAATQSLPSGQLPTNGTFLPTAVSPYNPLPGVPPASGATALAVFNGMNPNGYWSLYVFDDTLGNNGVITGGWSLGITTVITVNPAARLAAGMIHAPDPVFSGNFLSYLITVTNLGPGVATSVVLTDTLPAGAAFSSLAVSQGTATNNAGVVTCSLGTLAPGATATVTIQVVAGHSGIVVNTATVTTASTDLYLADATTANTADVLIPPVSYLVVSNLVTGLQLTLLGQASQNYAIQASTNLLSWTSVSTNTASLNGILTFTDFVTNAPLRFYRAVRVSQ
jgi:uncharacterized repeat protein (TIGR01451 family)